MKININDCFPEVTFHQIINGDPKTVNSSELFNKKVILVSVPGAFHPYMFQ